MDMEARLERLERQLASAQAGLEEVRARAFILVNRSGRECAKLTMGLKGPDLELRDEKGGLRAVLRVAEGGAFLELHDEEGVPRAALAVEPGGTILVMADEKRVARVRLQAREEGTSLMLFDEKETAIWSAPR